MTQEDFDKYIHQVEPVAKEGADAWRTAIGLQAVDGLKPSQYLLESARRNIDGDISIEEVRKLLDSYYKSKVNRTKEDDEEEEADKVSANIKKVLSSDTFAFNTNGFIATHRRVFEGVFKHAGKIRQYDITKKEWVLRGATVHYLNWEDLRRAIDYDIQQEKDFSYNGLDDDEKLLHIAHFVSNLWQIHPFGEGNTRTVAVFTIQYLRSMGFAVNNDLFANHSWYFRNALVRANYKNVKLGIDYDFSYLELFFRNLLLDENNELKNRGMLINPPAGWKETDDKSEQTDDKPTINYGGNLKTDDKLTIILDFIKKKGEVRTSEVTSLLGLKSTQTKHYIYQLLKDGRIVAHGANKNRTYSLP